MTDDGRYVLALDAGGTMTDTFLTDEHGRSYLGKSLTVPENEAASYLESVGDACETAGVSRSAVHAGSALGVYAGTGMLNLVLTHSGAQIGLLTTKGFELTHYLERGLTWLGQTREEEANFQLHEHTEPFVDFANVRGISERISGGTIYDSAGHSAGRVIIPLNEAEVETAVEEFLDGGVESIAIVFLCSYVNPAHERRAKEIAEAIVARRGVDVPVVISADICPRRGETNRMKATLLEAYGGAPARKQLFGVETAAKSDGYAHDMSTLLCYGSVANIRHPRMCESAVSGPIGGITGGKALADLKGWKNLVCCDLGGTSFDVGAIVDGLLPFASTMDWCRHRLNIPCVSIDSVGAGAGMEIHVDPAFKQVRLGPKSAGPNVGVCLRHPEITVADCDLALGYLSVDNFLGGKVRLDREKAIATLEERLAKPLGMDVYDAALGVLDLLHDRLGDHINGSLLSRGLNPGEYTVLAYGGSGPLHLWGLAERIEAAGICTVPWAAAFSAFGIVEAERFHRLEQTVVCILLPNRSPEEWLSEARSVDHGWRNLEERAYEELGQLGIDKDQIRFRYGITARYVGQYFVSWSAHVPRGRITADHKDVQMLIDSFEAEFRRIYPVAGRFPDAGYQIDSVFVEAITPRAPTALARYERAGPTPDPEAEKGRRQAYMPGGGWREFRIWDMDSLKAGNVIEGPSIIEHPMTTLVVPTANRVEFDEHKVIWYRPR